jgi:hypothetical protein
MRIALRTSGGRGEYELAGSHGDISVTDVIDHELTIQIFPNSVLPTGNFIRRLQGKPRIRLGDGGGLRHIYLVLADVLLLPKPKRELSKTPGGKIQLTDYNYSISSIQFDVVSTRNNRLTIQPTNLMISNSSDNLARLDVLERLRIILDVWSRAADRADGLGLLLHDHSSAVSAGDLENIKSTANEIRKKYENGDPLREILRDLSLMDQLTYWVGVHAASLEEVCDDDPTPPATAIEKRIREWRLQASRGAAGRKFSEEVKMAYSHTCLFTGDFLPKSDYVSKAGVDSAHILPWAQYDINSVTNGICLNKLCHWAFDQGVLRLDYIKSKSEYILTLGVRALKAEKEGLICLDGFKGLVGALPQSRLPSDRKLWPDPTYLEQYNDSLPR